MLLNGVKQIFSSVHAVAADLSMALSGSPESFSRCTLTPSSTAQCLGTEMLQQVRATPRDASRVVLFREVKYPARLQSGRRCAGDVERFDVPAFLVRILG